MSLVSRLKKSFRILDSHFNPIFDKIRMFGIPNILPGILATQSLKKGKNKQKKNKERKKCIEFKFLWEWQSVHLSEENRAVHASNNSSLTNVHHKCCRQRNERST